MSDILKEITNEKYQKKLLQSWIASRISYNDELIIKGQSPKIKDYEKNYSKFDHGIEKIVSSKDYTKTRITNNRIISKHVICECSNKRLIIALTIIKSEEKNFVLELFEYMENSPSNNFENISWPIENHASFIPIDHLIDKLVLDKYELVFTGYSFGAALAAFLAIRVLREITKRDCVQIDDLDRVLFIGFGCPLFVNETFQKFIENKQHEDKFYFYRHENDLSPNFFDLILKLISSSSSESKKRDFMIDRSIYHLYEWSKKNWEFFLHYLTSEPLNFSDSEFKQQPFVGFGNNLTISSTGNKIELNKFENYYNFETLKSKSRSIKSYNFNINDYFNNYFKVSIEQNYKTISYLDEFKIGRTFKYLFYPDFSRRHEKNAENTDHNDYFTVIINQPCIDNFSDVFLGIYNSERLYLKTVIGLYMHESGNIDIEQIYPNNLKTIWYQFKPTEKLIIGDRIKLEFTLYTLYEAILIKPPETIIEIELENSLYFDKKICSTYKLSLELLYIHTFFFIYLVKKSGVKDGQIFNNYNKIIDNFIMLDEELNPNGNGFKTIEDEERKYLIEQLYDQMNIENIVIDDNLAKDFSNLCDEGKNGHMETKLVKWLPSFFYMKRAIVNLVHENPKFLWTLLINNDRMSIESQIQDFKSKFRQAMWYFKVDRKLDREFDREADLKYIYAVKELEKKIPIDTNRLQYLGFYEKRVRDNKKPLENQDMEEVFLNKSKFLNSVVSNFNIREALVDSCLVGIGGDKKAGKSTFIDFFLKERGKFGRASIETNEMSAYRFSKEIDMFLVDYPPYNNENEFYRLQFEFSQYILDYAFLVCDANVCDTMTKNDLVNICGALKFLERNRYCVIMNKFDQVIDNFEKSSKHFLANEINRFLHKNKNLIISKLEEFDKSKHFQTNREELKNNLLIIPTTLNESSDPEIQYKYQRAGIFFGDDLKKKLLETIHDNIENKLVKSKLKDYYEKEKILKKCRFITKLNKKTIYEDIDINKGDEYNRIIDRIKESFNGIGDSFCIKPELYNPNSDLITSIDGFFDNKGFVFIVEKNIEKEFAFVKYPDLVPLLELDVTKNEGIAFDELQLVLREILKGKLKLKNLETFLIKPQLSLPDSSESITSIDGLFKSKGFTFIVKIYKKCSFEMKHHPEFKLLEVTINEDISFDELQSRIKEHFELEKLETFWIKPKVSLPGPSESITSIDGFFKSKETNFIVEIYKECFFEMKHHPELEPLNIKISKDIKSLDFQDKIREHFNLEIFETFSIKPQISEPYSSESINSIAGFIESKWFTFILVIYKECSFKMKHHPELKCLILTINEDISFDELQCRIIVSFRLENLETFWIKPNISLPGPSESITSTDGFFKSKGRDFIVEIYKECSFEMKHHPEFKLLEVTINEDISFNELQRKIKEHFELDKLETFWIKPKILNTKSYSSGSSITSIDGFFESKWSTFIVEIENLY